MAAPSSVIGEWHLGGLAALLAVGLGIGTLAACLLTPGARGSGFARAAFFGLAYLALAVSLALLVVGLVWSGFATGGEIVPPALGLLAATNALAYVAVRLVLLRRRSRESR